MKKYQKVYLIFFFSFFGGKMFSIFEAACFRNVVIVASTHFVRIFKNIVLYFITKTCLFQIYRKFHLQKLKIFR